MCFLNTPEMLTVNAISRSYGAIRALEPLSFELRAGEILGLVGPNGAGKTTAISIVAGLLLPDSGEVRLDTTDLFSQREKALNMIGFLPETPPLYPDMEVGEYLEFCAKARKIDRVRRARRIDEVVCLTGLAQRMRQPIGTLSRGYRQRVGLAQALVHEPMLLILDEPTSGLDPAQIADMQNVFRTLAAGGTAILFSTHILAEIEAVASHVLVMSEGRVVAHTTMKDVALEATESFAGWVISHVRGAGRTAS